MISDVDKEKTDSYDTIAQLIFGAIFLVLVSLSIGLYIGEKYEREKWKIDCVARGHAEYYRCYKMDNKRAIIDWKWKTDQTGMSHE